MKNRLFAVIAFLAIAMTSMGANSTNAAEARKMFDSTYNMVFGEQGSTLHYNVNIIGILKVDGTIWYKGKKSRFVESRYQQV